MFMRLTFRMESFDAINIGIPIYNEGKRIEKTLLYLKSSLTRIRFKSKPIIYLCFNGCTDETIYSFIKIFEPLKEYSDIRILSSKKGKLRAHKTIIDNIKNTKPIIFMDADVFVSSEVIEKLITTLHDNKNIIVASAYPYVVLPKDLSFYERIVYHIINIKRIYPKVEICKEDVSMFHTYPRSEFEKKSRIYFHGRCFIIRDKNMYEFPKDNSKIVGDDTFLSFIILKKYPPGSIKVLYDAQVFSAPQLSIISYLKSWFRIRKDLEYIYKEYPEFLKLRKYVKMKTNWNYVFKELPMINKIRVFVFYLLRIFETVTYKIFNKYIDIDKIWNYKNKENQQ